VVVGLIFWQVLFVQQYDSLQTSGVLRYNQLSATIAQREQYLRDLQTMQTNFLALDHRLLRDLPVVLPNDYASADVFSEIEQLFSDTGLSVRSVNISTLGQLAVDPAEATEEELAAAATNATSVGLNEVYEIVSITVSAAVETPAGTSAAETASISYSDFKKVLRRIEQQRHLLNLEQVVYSPTSSNFTLILKTYQQVSPIQ